MGIFNEHSSSSSDTISSGVQGPPGPQGPPGIGFNLDANNNFNPIQTGLFFDLLDRGGAPEAPPI